MIQDIIKEVLNTRLESLVARKNSVGYHSVLWSLSQSAYSGGREALITHKPIAAS